MLLFKLSSRKGHFNCPQIQKAIELMKYIDLCSWSEYDLNAL